MLVGRNSSTINNVTQPILLSQVIRFPPLAEQKRIVAKIDATFEKIDKLKANAEKNLANAKELFQSALDEAMRPKKGWVEKRLGEVCSITSNMVDPTLPQFENMLHVGGGNIVSETGELVDLKTAKEEKLRSGKYPFDMSMVLYNKIRPYLKKVARPFFKGLCSADMYPLLPNGGITRDYLYYLLQTTQFTTYVIGESERAGMPKVNREELFAYCMKIPVSLIEQEQIAKRLDLFSQKLETLQQNYARQIADCAEMRQAILREAFEGRM
jgi:type I restriction enzyme S subunit